MQFLSTMTSQTGRQDVVKAREAPIWDGPDQLGRTKWRSRSPSPERAENAGCSALAVTVDRSVRREEENAVPPSAQRQAPTASGRRPPFELPEA